MPYPNLEFLRLCVVNHATLHDVLVIVRESTPWLWEFFQDKALIGAIGDKVQHVHRDNKPPQIPRSYQGQRSNKANIQEPNKSSHC